MAKLLTVQEIAALMQVAPLTVRRWIYAKRLPAVKVGRLVRVTAADVERLIAENRTTGGMLTAESTAGSCA
jgi:excisionase family DNA binding protein